MDGDFNKAVEVALQRNLEEYVSSGGRIRAAINYYELGLKKEAFKVLNGHPLDEDGLLINQQEQDG